MKRNFLSNLVLCRAVAVLLSVLALPLFGCGSNPSGTSSGTASLPYYVVDNAKSSEVEITIHTSGEKPHTVWVPREAAPSAGKGAVVSRTITTGSVTSGKAEVKYSQQPFKIVSVTYDSQEIPLRK